MRIVLDYRPALRERTGVGEYVHELARALSRAPVDGESLVLFTSSWKDRPPPSLRQEFANVQVVDRHLPVRALTWAWNRVEWPPIERFTGECDLVHAQTPLLIPTRRAAQIVTIHDLDFLHHPERGDAEMRRDFPQLAAAHARRADHVIVSSHYNAGQVERHLGISPDRISVCSPGAPDWGPQVAARRAGTQGAQHILFLGTLQARKNVGRLIDAYRLLVKRRPNAPRLILAGRMTAEGRQWQRAASEAGLSDRVVFRGYVDESERRTLFAGARLLVLPSLEEGFGFPVLEAMACGVPVVVSNRGSLPEVAGEAAEPFPPEDIEALSARMDDLLDDGRAGAAGARGQRRAAHYSWAACALAARGAYRAAVAVRKSRGYR
ncbi:MAG: glycosyltransferase family 4 protein [Vicinamibacterales bacterium]